MCSYSLCLGEVVTPFCRQALGCLLVPPLAFQHLPLSLSSWACKLPVSNSQSGFCSLGRVLGQYTILNQKQRILERKGLVSSKGSVLEAHNLKLSSNLVSVGGELGTREWQRATIASEKCYEGRGSRFEGLRRRGEESFFSEGHI